ncbi:MAG TPA: hypothetical protein VHT75_19490 [Acidimicrobiales bacterium]|jgi:hypothetical protein|nr:hypothetical protein [Acidimicrobiales bacterium]
MTRRRRPVLSAALSEEAYAGFERFSAEHAITITATVEALGLILLAGLPARVVAEIEHIGHQVDIERRSRRRQ